MEANTMNRAERKQLKKKLREEAQAKAQESRQKRKRSAMAMKTSLVILALALAGFFLAQPGKTDITDPRGQPVMKIAAVQYDFGDVSVGGGAVSAAIDMKNEGRGNLVVKRLESSCMCTTASIAKDGIEGPVFGMHSSQSGWSQVIGPNETAQLKIYYDPTVHRDLRGPVTRIITVYSNDPANPQRSFRVDVNQVA